MELHGIPFRGSRYSTNSKEQKEEKNKQKLELFTILNELLLQIATLPEFIIVNILIRLDNNLVMLLMEWNSNFCIEVNRMRLHNIHGQNSSLINEQIKLNCNIDLYYCYRIELRCGNCILKEKEIQLTHQQWYDYITRCETIIKGEEVHNIIMKGMYHLLRYLWNKNEMHMRCIDKAWISKCQNKNILKMFLKACLVEYINFKNNTHEPYHGGKMFDPDYISDKDNNKESIEELTIQYYSEQNENYYFMLMYSTSTSVEWFQYMYRKLSKHVKFDITNNFILHAFTSNNLPLVEYFRNKYKFDLKMSMINNDAGDISLEQQLLTLLLNMESNVLDSQIVKNDKFLALLNYIFVDVNIDEDEDGDRFEFGLDYYTNIPGYRNRNSRFINMINDIIRHVGITGDNRIVDFFLHQLNILKFITYTNTNDTNTNDTNTNDTNTNDTNTDNTNDTNTDNTNDTNTDNINNDTNIYSTSPYDEVYFNRIYNMEREEINDENEWLKKLNSIKNNLLFVAYTSLLNGICKSGNIKLLIEYLRIFIKLFPDLQKEEILDELLCGMPHHTSDKIIEEIYEGIRDANNNHINEGDRIPNIYFKCINILNIIQGNNIEMMRYVNSKLPLDSDIRLPSLREYRGKFTNEKVISYRSRYVNPISFIFHKNNVEIFDFLSSIFLRSYNIYSEALSEIEYQQKLIELVEDLIHVRYGIYITDSYNPLLLHFASKYKINPYFILLMLLRIVIQYDLRMECIRNIIWMFKISSYEMCFYLEYLLNNSLKEDKLRSSIMEVSSSLYHIKYFTPKQFNTIMKLRNT